LKLEPDRMLHNFRVNAGLEPKAPVYGGWESVKTWEDIRAHGHTLGHYLTAAALMYASTGHEEMKRRVDYIVSELEQCQRATNTGLVNAFPDNTAQIENLVAGRRATGVPWYTLHKIFAGLRDAHQWCGSAPARGVLVKLADWAVATTKELTDAQFERMLAVEHGGMNEVLADVYLLTRDPRHLVSPNASVTRPSWCRCLKGATPSTVCIRTRRSRRSSASSAFTRSPASRPIAPLRSSSGRRSPGRARSRPAGTATTSISSRSPISLRTSARRKRWRRVAATTCCG
jgi:hypothetical protein